MTRKQTPTKQASHRSAAGTRTPAGFGDPVATPQLQGQQTRGQSLIREALAFIETETRKPGVLMTSPKLIADYFRLKLSGYDREVFAVAWLNLQYRLIEFRELFVGTVDRADVHLREVAKSGLACNAAAAIFAHNHPSGCAEPSIFDIEVTEYLETSLAGLGIAVLDHWIVTAETATSALRGYRNIGAPKGNSTCLAAAASTRRRASTDE